MMRTVIVATEALEEHRVMNARIRTAELMMYVTKRWYHLGAIVFLATAGVFAQPAPAAREADATANDLKPPAKGGIPVAFLMSEGAVMIDFAGPWEVFREAMVPGTQDHPFHLYTVAETTKPIHASGGMQIVPDYTLADAPAPKVVVIPAQSDPSPAVLEWIRTASKNTDVTMSVCTGAFILAQTGLLSGKSATTYHGAFKPFAVEFPQIHLKRGARFVEEGNLSTAGGLSSGIDLALRVVERYYGREAAQKTAYNMEYQGQGWMNPDSNQVYATAEPAGTAEHPLCPICDMDVDPASAPKSVFRGKTYYFCSPADKNTFDSAPEKFAANSKQL
jgi:putative intracellular protease/amidase/YHS domain-containing protein